jgi:hypothetical protein
MPYQRKPPLQTGGRADSAPPPSDSLDYSIESTTVRLKSIRLRRREKELLEAHQREAESKGAASRGAEPRRAEPKGPGATDERPSGRVRHDERGMAVWDWAVATGEFQMLSATSALKKLEATDLKIEETTRVGALSLEKAGRDKGGGFDPYNQRGSGRRQGEAAQRQGVTGAAGDDRKAILDQLLGDKNK